MFPFLPFPPAGEQIRCLERALVLERLLRTAPLPPSVRSTPEIQSRAAGSAAAKPQGGGRGGAAGAHKAAGGAGGGQKQVRAAMVCGVVTVLPALE